MAPSLRQRSRRKVSPAVIVLEGKEILVMVDIGNERASTGYLGRECCVVGPDIRFTMILRHKNKGKSKINISNFIINRTFIL